MQATLSPRAKTILDIAKRQPADTSRAPRASGDDFASKLADARSDRAPDAAAKETKPREAEEPSKPKPAAESKRVRRDRPTDDAEAKPDDVAANETAPQSKPSEAVSDEAPAEEVADPKKAVEAAPVKKDATAATNDAALTLVVAPAQAAAATAEAKPVEAAEGVAETAVLDVVAATTDEAEATIPEQDVEPAVLKAVAGEGEAKPKAKTADAKSADAKIVDTTEAAPARSHATNEQSLDADADAHRDASLLASDAADVAPKAAEKKSAESTFDAMLAKLTPEAPAPKQDVAAPAAPQPTMSAEKRFAADNVDNVVKSVRSQIDSAGGGQMRIRLDPPELGALEVAVKMVDGRMSASFTTSNDQATQLLSHNLNDLKSSLEASGISVDRIQVRQSSADNNAQQQPGSGEHRRDGSSAFDQPSQRGDQQRREAVEKMWRKLAYGSDELDFVA